MQLAHELVGNGHHPEYAAWLTGLLPSATVEVWPDLGHYPHLVEQERLLARVAEFEAQVRG